MKLSIDNNCNFCSRNSVIRFADDLAREVNKQFPCVSLSKTNYMPNRVNIKSLYRGETRLYENFCQLRDEIGKIIYSSKKNHTKYNEIMNVIKKYKTANCLELSMLALIFTSCAGIKSCSVKGLKGAGKKWLDHAVLYVADKKNPYIIDPWLGFADYLPKAFERYNGEFRQFLGLRTKKYFKDMKLVKVPKEIFPFQSLLSSKGFTQLSILKFANEKPELFIKARKYI